MLKNILLSSMTWCISNLVCLFLAILLQASYTISMRVHNKTVLYGVSSCLTHLKKLAENTVAYSYTTIIEEEIIKTFYSRNLQMF
jgi:hypothetical protein